MVGMKRDDIDAALASLGPVFVHVSGTAARCKDQSLGINRPDDVIRARGQNYDIRDSDVGVDRVWLVPEFPILHDPVALRIGSCAAGLYARGFVALNPGRYIGVPIRNQWHPSTRGEPAAIGFFLADAGSVCRIHSPLRKPARNGEVIHAVSLGSCYKSVRDRPVEDAAARHFIRPAFTRAFPQYPYRNSGPSCRS